MRIFLALSILFCPITLQAQWTHRYPQVDGFNHQVYFEGYELPILGSGPMDPAPSPSGGELAFSAKGWLWLLDVESGVARRITTSRDMDSRPEWSPGGDRLVFIRDTGSQLGIVSLDLESGKERVLVEVEAINLDPVFSPEGEFVVYASAESGSLEFWRVSLGNLERQRLTSVAEGKRRGVARRPQIVDPDSLILFLYKRGAHDSIELLNTVTGTSSTLLEDRITAQADIALSPDRRQLVYVWPYDGGHELRLMNISAPSTSVLLARSAGLPLAPAFSHDGAWIYFAEADDDERTELKRVRVGGGVVEPVAVTEWNWGAPTGKLIVRSEVDEKAAPVRMSALDAVGHPVIPETGMVRFEGQNGRVFFYSDGEIELVAPAGEVTISAVHGLETPETTQKVMVREDATTTVTLGLARVWDPSEHGWFAGDNHFHLNYGGPYRLEPSDIVLDLKGEAIDVAFPLLANLHNRFLEQDLRDWSHEQGPLIEFGQEVRSHFLGHVGLIGVDQLFWPWVWGPGYQVYGTDDRLNTEALRHARAQGGLGGYVHPVATQDPFTDENIAAIPKTLVADAVLGEVDLIELACLWTDEIKAVEFVDPERAPAAPMAAVYRAAALVRAGSETALAELESALAAARPAQSQPYLDLAIGQLQAGRWADAERTLLGILERAPGDPAVHRHLAAARAGLGRLEDAERDFRQALAATPDHPELRFNYGQLLTRRDRPEAALEQYRAALELRPNMTPAWFHAGDALARLDRLEEAVERYRQALAVDPGAARVHLRLANLLGRQERFEEAAAHYLRAAELEPSLAAAYLGGATALGLLGRFAEARSLLAEGLERHANDAGIAHALARLLAAAPDPAVRDGGGALELAKQLWRSEPRPEFLETMAMAMAEAGELERAAELQRTLVAQARAEGAAEILGRLSENPERYERGETCRSPWRKP